MPLPRALPVAAAILAVLVFVSPLHGVVSFSAPELLGRPTADSITVNVVAASAIEAYFEYGTQPGIYTNQTGTFSAAANEPLVASIDGLQANTRYFYRMQYRETGTIPWIARDEHAFHTARPQGATFTFTITSDSHVNVLLGNATLWQRTLLNIQNDGSDFHLDLGDTFGMDNVTTEAGARNAYLTQRPYMGLMSHSTPVFLVLGNHEQEEAWHRDDTGNLATSKPILGAMARKRYFLNPTPNAFYSGNTDAWPVLGGDHLPADYYAWQWGDALFIAIDPYWYTTTKPFTGNLGGGESSDPGSGDRWDWTLGPAQYAWLKQVLETSTAKYKFMFAHHGTGGTEDYIRGGANAVPFNEWGGYNENGTTWAFDVRRPGWYAPIHQLLVENHLTAFFHGHDHEYAHEQRDGVVYQAMPMGAETAYSFGFQQYSESDPYTIRVLPNSGHLRVTVSPASATVEYVRSFLPGDGTNGQVADTYAMSPGSGTPNALPTVATPASATPNPVTASTTNVSALGADDAGEGNLIYTWATTGTPPAAVTFSANGTNAARNSVATFTQAGSYTLQVTIRDAGNLTVTSSVAVTVNATPPGPASIAYVQGASITNDAGATTIARAFTTSVAAGNLIVAAVSWGSSATLSCTDSQANVYAVATTQHDSVNNQSLGICYAANAKAGTTTVTATFSSSASYRRLLIHEYSGIAQASPVDVVAKNLANGTTSANAITSTAVMTTTNGDLIFGAVMDDDGVTGITAGTGFTQRQSVNNKDLASEDLVQALAGSIAATQTFAASHRYLAQLVAFKAGSSVPQTLTSIAVTPANVSVDAGATRSFAANALDQFGVSMSPQPAIGWTVSGGGTINAAGLFTAGSTAGGPFVVTASSSGVSGTASVTVTPVNAPPTLVTPASALPNPVIGATTTLSVLGADDAGEANLTYTWATTGTPPAAVGFGANGTNAAKSVIATFTRAGTYNFQVTLRDAGNLTATSAVGVTVNATPTSITVAPANASVLAGASQAFAATSRDQFGVALTSQPAFAWDVSGGGTINAAGLFTAGPTPGGPFTVTAASGGLNGTAGVTITAPASVAYVQGAGLTNDGSATTVAQSFTAAATAGNLVVLAVSWGSNATVTCSDSQGNSYAVVTTQYDSMNEQSLAICYAANIKSGATTVTATFSGSAPYRRLLIHEYRGLALAGAVDVSARNLANGTTAANAITSTAAMTTANGDLIFGAFMDDAGVNNIAAGTGFTLRQSLNNRDLVSEDLVQGTAGAIAATATFSTAHRYLAQMVAFKRQ